MTPADRQALFLLYDAPDSTAQVQVVVRDETIWMTQKAMATLFDVNVPAISKHLKNIFESGELNENTTVSKMEIVVNRGVQNRFHYAITGQTAAEIIYTHADHTQEHMGLKTWKNSPDGRILKSDVTVAKNYLDEKQIRQLERTVTGYFDYIEDLIERENTFNMEQFASSVNEFLSFRRYNILPDKGRISKSQADTKAEAEYDIFNRTQPITSDFDKAVKQMIEQEGKNQTVNP